MGAKKGGSTFVYRLVLIFKCYVALPKLLSPPSVVVCFYHLIALTIFFLNNKHKFSVFVYNDCFALKNSIGIFSLEVW